MSKEGEHRQQRPTQAVLQTAMPYGSQVSVAFESSVP